MALSKYKVAKKDTAFQTMSANIFTVKELAHYKNSQYEIQLSEVDMMGTKKFGVSVYDIEAGAIDNSLSELFYNKDIALESINNLMG